MGADRRRRQAVTRPRELAGLLLLAAASGLAPACARRETAEPAAIERARGALRRARIEAPGLAPAELARAVAASARLERRLAEERDSLSLARREPIAPLAEEAESAADIALAAALREGARRHAELAGRHAELSRRLAALDGFVDRTPADQGLHERFGRARLELDMAATALAPGARGGLPQPAALETAAARLANAAARLDAAAADLDRLEGRLGERYARLRDPALVRRWQSWVDETFAGSRQGGAAVVVDKLAGRCYLLQGGRLTAAFAAELGRNGLADKLYAGDEATPEGRYRVTDKRDGDATRYHRALLLDYPTPADLRDFGAARGRGLVPAGRGPGSGIEIHGHGGRSLNWTNGCVALRDDEMERLFAAVEVGTPVTIVGTARLPGAAGAAPPEGARP